MRVGYSFFAFCLASLAGCTSEHLLQQAVENEGQTPISLSGHIDQQYTTRAGQDGFADGDRIGTFIVDYVDGKPGELLPEGNRADNLYYSYNNCSLFFPPFGKYFYCSFRDYC